VAEKYILYPPSWQKNIFFTPLRGRKLLFLPPFVAEKGRKWRRYDAYYSLRGRNFTPFMAEISLPSRQKKEPKPASHRSLELAPFS